MTPYAEVEDPHNCTVIVQLPPSPSIAYRIEALDVGVPKGEGCATQADLLTIDANEHCGDYVSCNP